MNIRREEVHFSKIGVATGNWGCGAFGGDPEVKAIIQWLAASQVIVIDIPTTSPRLFVYLEVKSLPGKEVPMNCYHLLNSDWFCVGWQYTWGC